MIKLFVGGFENLASIKSLGNFKFGGSSKRILVDGYSFLFQDIPVEIFLNSKNCIPIAETTFVRKPNQLTISAIAFSNFTTIIEDPSVFNIPPVCSETAIAVVEVSV